MEQLVPELKRSLQAQYGHLMIRWYEAVDWTEPLIVGALASHALLFVAAFATRKRLAIQAALFAAIVLLVAVTEPLNSWGQRNWRRFATQNYFDPRGVFMGLFYAGPLLAAGFFQLVRACCVVCVVCIETERD